MAMAVGGGSGARADINMTPMIDILLVLIIIFMVITPLTPKGLESMIPQPPPKDQPPSKADDRTVVIIINKDKSIMINSEPIADEAALGNRLEQIFKTRAERLAFIKGDPDLEFQVVAKAIDVAKGVGIDKIGLMTPKVEAGE